MVLLVELIKLFMDDVKDFPSFFHGFRSSYRFYECAKQALVDIGSNSSLLRINATAFVYFLNFFIDFVEERRCCSYIWLG